MMTGKNNRFMSEINVTPFVDVMLVLLIIFMVTAPMMVQGVNVTLPEARAKSITSDKEHIVVTIDDNSRILINDFEVTVDFLQEKLTKILEGRIEREVYLKADKNIAYGTVVKVMAEIKGAGVEKLGMVTEPVKNDMVKKQKS